MATTSQRYPATSYDRDLTSWEVKAEPISQAKIGSELASTLAFGIPVQGGPLREQLPDGRDGKEFGAVSIVWSQAVQDDGSRTVLGWYETGR